jgi:hypothetical protein
MTHSLHEQNLDKWHLNRREYSETLFPSFSDIRHVIHLTFNTTPVPGTQTATRTSKHKWHHCIFVGPCQSPRHEGKSGIFQTKVAHKKDQTCFKMSTLHGEKGRGEWLWVYMTDIFQLTLQLRSGILCKSEFNTNSRLCYNVEVMAGKIEIPTQWNLIGSRITAPSPVLSPSSILRYLRFIAL